MLAASCALLYGSSHIGSNVSRTAWTPILHVLFQMWLGFIACLPRRGHVTHRNIWMGQTVFFARIKELKKALGRFHGLLLLSNGILSLLNHR